MPRISRQTRNKIRPLKRIFTEMQKVSEVWRSRFKVANSGIQMARFPEAILETLDFRD